MKNQENVSKEYYLEGYIYLALSSQKSIALFLGKVENLKNLRENIEYSEQAEDLLMAAKYFERIDDHVTNFEWVIFSITGCHVDDE